MKTCSKCKAEKEPTDFGRDRQKKDGLTSQCKACQNRPEVVERKREHYRGYYAEHYEQNGDTIRKQRRAYKAQNPQKRIAHQLVDNALKCGKLLRPDTCSACGCACKPDGHHDDYNQPLTVRWLCRACHQQHHDATDRQTQ